jgi:uncharacterized protein
MSLAHAVIIAYVLIYLVTLVLAFKHRKTFPFTESLMVVGIVGVAFTALVWLVTLPVKATPITTRPSAAELAFTLIYLVVTAVLLVLRPAPKDRPDQFMKEKISSLAFKLLVFVFIPLAILRLVWHVSWADLGFSAGDMPGQLFAAAVLILCFGGFNFFAGSAAAPIRKHQYSTRQALLGLGVAFLWNILETGLVEEFYFRAFIQTQLTNAFNSPFAGICLASLLFGLAHAPGIYLRSGDKSGPLGEKPTLLNSILYSVVVLSTAGWSTGLLYWKTQSLLAPILVHAATDAVAHAVELIEGLHLRG